MMDCVAGETYFGVRAVEDAVAGAGIVIVKRAVDATVVVEGGTADCAPGTLCAPPPEQFHNAASAKSATARMRGIGILIRSGRSASTR